MVSEVNILYLITSRLYMLPSWTFSKSELCLPQAARTDGGDAFTVRPPAGKRRL